jgi:Zn finger protein HypA/HybF involved in hydrogenase expression
MNLNALFNSIGNAGLFSTRIFLPAFLTALLLRFGPQIPLIHHLGLLGHLQHNHPVWFTSDYCIIALGILSILEMLAQKNPEARNLLHEFDIYLKPALAILTSFGVIQASDASFATQTAHQAGLADDFIPLISGLLTWRLSVARKQVAIAVFDHIEGTHLDHLLSWLEDAWVAFGSLLLILLPLVMLLLIAIATAILYLLRKRLEIKEEQAKFPCPKCQTLIYPSAIACPRCRQPNPNPHALGFLGQSKDLVTPDLAHHPYRLTEKRRCATCAAPRPLRKPFDPCHSCGTAHYAEPEFTTAYADFIAGRLPIVLGVSFLMSLVPILGLIVASVYYRMELVLPFSQYLPLSKRFILRWAIRALFIVMIFLQIIPIVGGFVAPLMAYISFVAYRNSYLSLMQSPQQNYIPAPGLAT